ncbi:MAG TPA: UDP-N-acetylmuramoyl-L-alanine--D-glutamate ligase [bacterium]|mgnify:CR=1 FL=1|nr:UDP-N-acetylmuramoyl-L-alanine--D-glutamate ligase [bacterium]
MMDVAGKKYLIVGIARSGLAAAELLQAHGATVLLNDGKPAEKLGKFAAGYERFPHHLGGHPLALLDGVSGVIASPGVPPTIPLLVEAQRRGIELIGEIELGWRFCRGTLVGITGTNGKTTTTTLTGELLRAAGLPAVTCGNMGHPLARAAQEAAGAERVFVCELSSFQLEGISSMRPRVGVLLNLTPDHQDRYPDLESYFAAKGHLYDCQTADDWTVVNCADDKARALAETSRARRIHIGAGADRFPWAVYPSEGNLCWRRDGNEEVILPATAISIPGPHNLENAMAAAAVALAYGVAATTVAAVLRTFRGVEHRLEPVLTIDGVTFINDSKGTNVDAVVKSLQSYRQPIVWLGCGRDKGGDFTVLDPLVQMHVRAVVLFGELAETIERALTSRPAIVRATDMADAVRKGFAAARPGDVVLLSPGGTSFDWYSDFEERGRVFKDAVRALAAERAR